MLCSPLGGTDVIFLAWLRSALFGVFSSVWFPESPSADKWTFGILKKYYVSWMTQVLQMCNRRKILFLSPGLLAILLLEQVWLQKVKKYSSDLLHKCKQTHTATWAYSFTWHTYPECRDITGMLCKMVPGCINKVWEAGLCYHQLALYSAGEEATLAPVSS